MTPGTNRLFITRRALPLFSVVALILPCALWAASPLAEQWLAHVRILAADDMQGRAPGTPGYRKAAEYVADQLKQAGVKPFFGNSYFQTVGLRSRRVLREGTSVTLIRENGAQQQLAISDDYGLNASNELPPSVEAPLAFIGYGNYLPEAKLNDTAGIDLKGKIVVYIQGAPSGTSTVARAHAAASLNRR